MEFLYLGNLILEKGVLVLLEACRFLAHEGKNFRCHIVGAGTKELSVEDCRTRVKKLDLIDLVEVHGPLYGEEKEKMWKQCDAFVFPTFYHNECFPLVILEAMQHALPIIASPVGAIPDMVINEETGLIVPSKDAHALASAMTRLMVDVDFENQCGERGYHRYSSLYTKNKFEEMLISIVSEQ